MRTDINTFVGRYPWQVGESWNVGTLAGELRHSGIESAWVSDLDAIFGYADARAARWLCASLEDREGLRPLISVDPGRARWEAVLDLAVEGGGPAVRCDPTVKGIELVGVEMRDLVAACAERRMPLMLTVRFEDVRQRVTADNAPDLPPWAVRRLIRSHPAVKLVVANADREFIEQVHFGSTPDEANRILWDINWIWGPPEDHLALLLETVGIERFALGTGTPLRLTENGIAKLDLLDLGAADRTLVESGNAQAFAAR